MNIDNFNIKAEHIETVKVDMLIEIYANVLANQSLLKSLLDNQEGLKSNFQSILNEEIEGFRSSIRTKIFELYSHVDLDNLDKE